MSNETTYQDLCDIAKRPRETNLAAATDEAPMPVKTVIRELLRLEFECASAAHELRFASSKESKTRLKHAAVLRAAVWLLEDAARTAPAEARDPARTVSEQEMAGAASQDGNITFAADMRFILKLMLESYAEMFRAAVMYLRGNRTVNDQAPKDDNALWRPGHLASAEDFLHPIFRPPAPEVWEIMRVATSQGLGTCPDGWEPFAAHGPDCVWLRRRKAPPIP